MKTTGRLRSVLTRARRILRMKKVYVRDKRTVSFRKPKLVGAVIRYGDHMIRLIHKLEGNIFMYESVKWRKQPKYK